MVGRLLSPIWVDEFTAPHLEALLDTEMERLKDQLHKHRDNADRMAWARTKACISGLHLVWHCVRAKRDSEGAPSAEDLADINSDLERIAREMPRSKANAAALRAEREAQQARRSAAQDAIRAAKEELRRL